MDDLYVYGKRTKHLKHLRLTFDRLAMFGCSFSPEKYQLGHEEGVLLGHVVFNDVMKVDPGKLLAILALQPPKNAPRIKKMWGR